jgi:hypothetical protein
MGKAIIKVSPKLLFELLKLPDNFKFVACNLNFQTQVLSILVENDEIEETPECGEIPVASVILKTEIYRVTTLNSIKVLDKEIEPINMSRIPALVEVIE